MLAQSHWWGLPMIHRLGRIGLVAAALLAAAAARAEAAESLAGRYFMVVWGYQGASGAPEAAHTFISFYRGSSLRSPLTISWLPASGVVRPGVVVPGHNFSLQQTLQMARSHGYQVKSYGPYEIRPELYHQAAKRVRELNSGRWKYTMVNGPQGAMNCIEAAGSIISPISTMFDYGFAASQDVAQHLSQWIVDYPNVQEAVADRLDLGGVAQRDRGTTRDSTAEMWGGTDAMAAAPRN
jgi:hypothetical protein